LRKIAIANRKGGVGKTTTAVNVAAGLALAGNTVLLIDTDTQGHCSRLLGVDPEKGLAELIDETCTPAEALIMARDGLFLLAGSKKLSGIMRSILKDRIHGLDRILLEALQPYDGKYDFVILDTAPGFSEMSINVLIYADELLIPVNMEIPAIDGLKDLASELKQLRKYTDIDVKYIVPTFYEEQTKITNDILMDLKNNFGELVSVPIRKSVKIRESWDKGLTMFEYAIKERATKDYALLTRALA